MALSGNTVRLKCEFKTFDDEYDDPDNITLKIFDKDKVQVGATIEITDAYKTDTGKYEYDYTIPALSTLIEDLSTTLISCTKIFYEFSGTLEGETLKGRDKIIVNWTP